MEEANISAINPISNQSLITMDDLFIQIGKLHIDKINGDKILVAAYKQFDNYKKSTEEKIKQLSNTESVSANEVSSINIKLQKLIESNNLYQKNNNVLANKLKDLTIDTKIKTNLINKLKKDIVEELDKKDNEIKILKKKLNEEPVKKILKIKK